MEVQLLNSAALFATFQRGWRLMVRAAAQEFVFSLDNSSNVLAAALECVRRYKSAGQHTQKQVPSSPNPFARKAPSTSESANAAKLQVEAVALTANVLSASGIQGFELANAIPPHLAMFHALWTAPGIVGGLRIEMNETIGTAPVALIANSAQNCKESFATVKLPAGSDAARLKTACVSTASASSPNRHVNYTILKRAAGGVFVFLVIQDAGTGEAADQSGERLYDAAMKTVLRK